LEGFGDGVVGGQGHCRLGEDQQGQERVEGQNFSEFCWRRGGFFDIVKEPVRAIDDRNRDASLFQIVASQARGN
jgi:hypothetical protein